MNYPSKHDNILLLPTEMDEQAFDAWLKRNKVRVAENKFLPADLRKLSQLTDIQGCIVMFVRIIGQPAELTGKGEPDSMEPVLSRQSIGCTWPVFFGGGYKLPKGQRILVRQQ